MLDNRLGWLNQSLPFAHHAVSWRNSETAIDWQALQVFQTATNKEGGVDGQPLEFIFYDDQTSPQTTVQITNGILSEKPAVMLGSSIVAMCNAIAPLLKEGPFDYCLSPGVHPTVGSYQYSTNADTHSLIEALVRYFRLRGFTKIAFISSTCLLYTSRCV